MRAAGIFVICFTTKKSSFTVSTLLVTVNLNVIQSCFVNSLGRIDKVASYAKRDLIPYL